MRHRFARPKVRKLDLSEIELWLPSIGFTAEKITQEWRHVVAFGAYEGKACVLKLASTQATGKHTLNEKNWNDAVHLTDPATHRHFIVPKVYASGTWNKLYYFICDWYVSRPISRLQAFDAARVKEWLPVVAKTNYEIESLKFPSDCEFVKKRINSRSSKIPADQKLVLAAREWAEQVPRDLSKLVEFLETVNHIETAPAHGDFVLRQMFDLDGKIGLIDGEHAGAKGALHYDTAQMYMRLVSDYDAWDIALEYLKIFKSLLPKEKQLKFWEDLKPPLIQRYIGDLWGSKNNPANLERLLPIKDMILNNKIV